MIKWPKPPTQWDQDMVDLLSPLASRQAPPKLRYHFFANTFPLAYHYAWALLEHSKDPEQFAEYSPGFTAPQGDQWGYSTQSDASDRVHHINVSLFRPRLAFVERTLWTHRVADRIRPEEHKPLGFSRFLEAVVGSKLFEPIAVYAEIPQLGAYLQALSAYVLGGSPEPDVYSVGEGGKLLLVPCAQGNQTSSTIRFFIYGGPLSTYLRRKTNRYIALDLESSGPGNLELLRTVLILPDGVTADEREKLENYHQRLYGDFATRRGQCVPFSGVYRAFNEVAWLLQSRASFRDAKEFWECIVTHHRVADEAVSIPRPGD